MTRQLTEAGLDLIKSFESDQPIGMLPTPNDVPTAGWGHTGPDVQLGVFYPPEVRKAWLVADTQSACAEVERDATVPLTDEEFGALVCLVFNIGRGAFRGSTLLKMLNAGQHQQAAQQFLRWNKQSGKELAGLDRRRAAEMALFNTPDQPQKEKVIMPTSPQNTGAMLGVGAALLDLANWWYTGHAFPLSNDVEAAFVVVGGYFGHHAQQVVSQVFQAILARFPAKTTTGQPG